MEGGRKERVPEGVDVGVEKEEGVNVLGNYGAVFVEGRGHGELGRKECVAEEVGKAKEVSPDDEDAAVGGIFEVIIERRDDGATGSIDETAKEWWLLVRDSIGEGVGDPNFAVAVGPLTDETVDVGGDEGAVVATEAVEIAATGGLDAVDKPDIAATGGVDSVSDGPGLCIERGQ